MNLTESGVPSQILGQCRCHRRLEPPGLDLEIPGPKAANSEFRAQIRYSELEKYYVTAAAAAAAALRLAACGPTTQ